MISPIPDLALRRAIRETRFTASLAHLSAALEESASPPPDGGCLGELVEKLRAALARARAVERCEE